MKFLIADTFTDSLSRLTGDEQKAAKTTAFDLQVNPAGQGKRFHRLDGIKDKNFWSARVNDDIRIIAHKTADSLLLCYVDHHTPAYNWAERRKLETHPKTGAAQMVEIRETVKEVIVPKFVEQVVEKKTTPKKKPFAALTDEALLGYGVPAEWLADVRAADEDSILGVATHLPAEAADALLVLAIGGKPKVAQAAAGQADPFAHPDAKRRFRVMESAEELQRALDFPWEKWIVFLHPDQQELVERGYAGPARVTGSAGTGKTIVALHRAVYLARNNPDGRVLLTTFSDPLAHALQARLKRLLAGEPKLAERIDVASLDAVGLRLYKAQVGPVSLADRPLVLKLLEEASDTVEGHKFKMSFLISEWDQVVDAWQLATWDEYRDVARLGRKTRLPEAQRKTLWAIFEHARKELRLRKVVTQATLFTKLADAIKTGKNKPFDFAVVDEAQDVGVAQLRFFAAVGGDRPDALFFAGDIAQRIFQQAFSWKPLGVDVRGRSRTLKVNYRTSHQIREQADRLLGPEVGDADGNAQERKDTVSVFNGPPPDVRVFATQDEEIKGVGEWLLGLAKAGVLPHEVGLFVRSDAQLERAKKAAKQAKLPFKVLDDHVETQVGYMSIGTMHLAKGLEFRAVAVMACDDEVIPLQERIESVGDDADLQEVYDTERYLLYVACTRARDRLLVTSTKPASEFLEDMEP
ncbi:MAG: DNA helicase [Planctomycetaceae bacterium]|nr:DNA helicase [Planctomycetaceae bacterium]